MLTSLKDPKLFFFLLNLCFLVAGWAHRDSCPSSKWNAMCRPCCEYQLIQCRCPSRALKVGYTVPCCRNALDQCDPCIIHPGCSLFENCKACHNGTWRANDDFFVNGKYCTECRQGWSGGDCKTCGGIIQRAQGHIALESYPTNIRCEWTVQVEQGSSVELRFTQLSLESDHNCRYDYVEVRDGDDLRSPVIGRFCGDQLPPPMKSSGNLLHILFTSDGYNNFNGFVLTFQESPVLTIKNVACAPPEEPQNGYLQPVYSPHDELAFVTYWCHPPFILTGAQQRACLPNGTWSGSVPSCVKGPRIQAQCGSPPKLLHGYHRRAPDAAGGAETIEFFCKNSYILSGNHQSTCLSNGSWSSRPPKCVRACREPKVSELVRQIVVKPHLLSRYNLDDLLSAGFIPLMSDRRSNEGRDVAALEEIPLGFHPVYTSIKYKCVSPLYRNTGSSRRTCLETGRWSGHHVSCSPVCGKLDSFSTHNLSDIQWPWHAAIHIRSPPDHTVSSHRRIMLDQQGSSEESTFWHLVCSGALVAQRRILVVAQCVVDKDKRQPFHPAHVRVVIGTQVQASRDPWKSLHYLRVSDILIHPNFNFSLDSDVAMLKLKDKVKVSERVLPVCLPKIQRGEVTATEVYTARWILPHNHQHLRRYTTSSQTKPVELSDAAQCEREFTGGGTAAISDNTLCVVTKQSSSQSPCPSAIPGITVIPAVLSSTSGVSSGHEETLGASSAGWQLVGLESFIYEKNNCHQQVYTAQTHIANFQKWIKESMK